MTNAPGAEAYPIAASTFILLPKQPKDKAKSDAGVTFFKYALEKGQDQANKLDYVPLPSDLVQQIESYISQNVIELDGRLDRARKGYPQERRRR